MSILPDRDRLLAALGLVALLLYLTPMAWSSRLSAAARRRLQWAAILTLLTGLGFALAETMIWLAN